MVFFKLDNDATEIKVDYLKHCMSVTLTMIPWDAIDFFLVICILTFLVLKQGCSVQVILAINKQTINY